MKFSRPVIAFDVLVALSVVVAAACHGQTPGPSTRPIGSIGNSTAATQNSDQAPVLLHFDQNNHN